SGLSRGYGRADERLELGLSVRLRDVLVVEEVVQAEEVQLRERLVVCVRRSERDGRIEVLLPCVEIAGGIDGRDGLLEVDVSRELSRDIVAEGNGSNERKDGDEDRHEARRRP